MSAPAITGNRLSALLRRYRTASGLTQEELAERSGLSTHTIANIECGRTVHPYRRSIRLIADALELTGAARDGLTRAARPVPDTTPTPEPAPADAPPPRDSILVTPKQLPPVPDLVGRSAELNTLSVLLGPSGTPARLAAITGTAGVGKTTLAVYWAHRAADHFRDGQLYVNLRGFDPSGKPVAPHEAIRGFLQAMGYPQDQIPDLAADRTGLYRSLMADRAMLIVLDNARDAAQVRPLLPGNPSCVVVVTSRNQLTGLAASDGAVLVSVDLLGRHEARKLLAHRLGAARLAAEPGAVDTLVDSCVPLPLALAIVAARAASRPSVTADELAAELRGSGALDTMDTGEVATSLRAVFSWSYRMVSPAAARLFRLLGVHPGPDVTAAVAAALAGQPVAEANFALRELAASHLVFESSAGRYGFHDMLRAYAAELATTSGTENRVATERALDYYLHTAHRAVTVLHPSRDPITLPEPASGVTPEALASADEAIAWLRREHRVLLGAIDWAARQGLDTHVTRLAWALTDFHDNQGLWTELVATHRLALEAAGRLDDLAAKAYSYRTLGRAYARQRSFDAATEYYRLAADMARQRGDVTRQAHGDLDLAWIYGLQNQHVEALAHARAALAIYRSADHQSGQAVALNAAGWSYVHLGDHEAALACCEEALAVYRDLGDRDGEAAALDSVGLINHQRGQYRRALEYFRRSTDLFAALGDRYHVGEVLVRAGDTALAAGDRTAARNAWTEALEILDDLHDAGAGAVWAKLQRIAET